MSLLRHDHNSHIPNELSDRLNGGRLIACELLHQRNFLEEGGYFLTLCHKKVTDSNARRAVRRLTVDGPCTIISLPEQPHRLGHNLGLPHSREAFLIALVRNSYSILELGGKSKFCVAGVSLALSETNSRATQINRAQASCCVCLRTYFFLGGPIRSQVRPGFWVGGSGLSPGSMVTCLGFGTLPPLDPRSTYSPGRAGVSPGFCLVPIFHLP